MHHGAIAARLLLNKLRAGPARRTYLRSTNGTASCSRNPPPSIAVG
jgi:hypothetical protein